MDTQPSLTPAAGDLDVQVGEGWLMYRQPRFAGIVMDNEALTRVGFEGYLRALADDLGRLRPGQPKRAVLYELSGERSFMDAARRKQVADLLAHYRGVLAQVTAGYVMVSGSAVARGVLTAIFWLDKPPYATRVAGNLDEGLAWLAGQMPELDVEAAARAHERARSLARSSIA